MSGDVSIDVGKVMLEHFRSRGFALALDKENIAIRPASQLTAEDRQTLRELKPLIVGALVEEAAEAVLGPCERVALPTPSPWSTWKASGPKHLQGIVRDGTLLTPRFEDHPVTRSTDPAPPEARLV